MNEFKLGWLRKAEINDAANIEWYSSERFWKERDFSLIFKHGNVRNVVPLACRVEDKPKNEKLIAYCIYRKSIDSYNVLNMVVHPEYRRMGIGRLFIKNLMYNLLSRKHDRDQIKIRIRDAYNRGSHSFLKALHFDVNQIVPEFYCNYDKIGNVTGKGDAIEYFKGINGTH